MSTIFKVDGQGYEVKGCGQEATKSILQKFPKSKIILIGFRIGDKTIKAEIN